MNGSRLAFAATLVIGLSVAACTSGHGSSEHPGARLARTYCASCHAFPEPQLLDQERWAAVLPDMGGRLGVYTTMSRDSLIKLNPWGRVDPASVFPVDPVLSREKWDSIVAYYMTEAPVEMPAERRRQPATVGLAGFEVRVPGTRFEPPLTSMVEIDDLHGVFFVGNFTQSLSQSEDAKSALVALDPIGRMVSHWKLDGAPVAVRAHGNALLVLSIGSNLAPSGSVDGTLLVAFGPNTPMKAAITGLERPVDFEIGDLSGDGQDDVLICEYGHHAGRVSWYEAAGDGTFVRHVLHEGAGAVDAALRDFDGDGRLDVGVLMAQGDEGFDVYTNAGGGQFQKRRVLRFSPVHGSNHLEVVDFNRDGILDLLLSNGDNADLTPIPKSYHGIRIFLGERDGSFRERLFFPLNGAISAKPADFDQDGDLDIAAIAYFPDYARAPQESFVLLENAGDFTFKAYTFEDSQRGRWITMDVGDLDGDRDTDILLGSNIGFSPAQDQTGLAERWTREAPSFIMLENQHARSHPAP